MKPEKNPYVKTLMTFIFIGCLAMFFGSLYALAEMTTVATPETFDLKTMFDMIVSLISNWKVLGAYGIAIAIMNVVIYILKAPFTDALFTWNDKAPIIKRLIVLVVGMASGIVMTISTGSKWYVAIVNAIVVSGGGIAIYEVIKPLFNKSGTAAIASK